MNHARQGGNDTQGMQTSAAPNYTNLLEDFIGNWQAYNQAQVQMNQAQTPEQRKQAESVMSAAADALARMRESELEHVIGPMVAGQVESQLIPQRSQATMDEYDNEVEGKYRLNEQAFAHELDVKEIDFRIEAAKARKAEYDDYRASFAKMNETFMNHMIQTATETFPMLYANSPEMQKEHAGILSEAGKAFLTEGFYAAGRDYLPKMKEAATAFNMGDAGDVLWGHIWGRMVDYTEDSVVRQYDAQVVELLMSSYEKIKMSLSENVRAALSDIFGSGGSARDKLMAMSKYAMADAKAQDQMKALFTPEVRWALFQGTARYMKVRYDTIVSNLESNLQYYSNPANPLASRREAVKNYELLRQFWSNKPRFFFKDGDTGGVDDPHGVSSLPQQIRVMSNFEVDGLDGFLQAYPMEMYPLLQPPNAQMGMGGGMNSGMPMGMGASNNMDSNSANNMGQAPAPVGEKEGVGSNSNVAGQERQTPALEGGPDASTTGLQNGEQQQTRSMSADKTITGDVPKVNPNLQQEQENQQGSPLYQRMAEAGKYGNEWRLAVGVDARFDKHPINIAMTNSVEMAAQLARSKEVFDSQIPYMTNALEEKYPLASPIHISGILQWFSDNYYGGEMVAEQGGNDGMDLRQQTGDNQ